MFTPTIFKQQKSTLGYNYTQLKKRIRECETIGGNTKQYIVLSCAGFVRQFDVKEITEEFLIIQSGLVQYKIVK